MFGFKNNKDRDTKKETSVAIGAVVGAIIGILTDNVGLWLPLGTVMGLGIGIGASRARSKK
jgi:F0F1-type ATP synthase assembly protein I